MCVNLRKSGLSASSVIFSKLVTVAGRLLGLFPSPSTTAVHRACLFDGEKENNQ